MIRERDREFLLNVPFFQHLSSEQQETIFSRMVTTVHPKGSLIFKQGDEADALFIVCRGTLEIYRSDSPKEYADVLLCSLNSGDYCGEFCLIGPTRRLTTAMASQETHLLQLKQRDFNELIEKDPSLGLQVTRLIAEDLIRPFQQHPEFFFQAIRML